MKRFCTLLLFGSACLQAHDVMLEVTGEIVNEACTLNYREKPPEVAMGEWETTHFSLPGSASDHRPFTLVLSQCINAITGVRVSFQGEAAAANPQLLKLDQQSISGLAIELSDANREPLAINQRGIRQPLLPEVDNVLHFHARYISLTPPITAGAANATALLSLEYD